MKKALLSFLIGILCLAGSNAQIVISEIMYNPPEAGTDSLEFVEFYNTTNAAINLENWSTVGFDLTFDAAATIAANDYLVVAVKASAMQSVFGVSAIEWTSGGLSNGGETIQLLDSQGTVIDEVDFENSSPWPISANALGYSMELCDLTADNSLPESWKKSGTNTGLLINNLELFASPGAQNGANCLPDADYTIIAQGLSFTPADITINEGETILWVNQGGNHNVDGSLASFPNNPEGFSNGPASNAAWTFVHTFNVPGDYNYDCSVHAGLGMVGTVTVLPYSAPNIVITEFMFNDPGPDSLEYLEIYNQDTNPVDISGWVFSAGVTHVFANGTVIQPDGYLVLAKHADYFNSFFGFLPIEWNTGQLTNSGELIELRDASGNVIDQFAYTPSSPWPTGTNGQGSSVVLCDPSTDNAQPGNWIAANTSAGFMINGIEVFANPNAPAGCSGNTDATNDMATIAQNTSVLIGVLENDFLPGGATSLSISSNPNSGTVVVQGDSILYMPNPDFCGDDAFSYEVCTANSCDIATVDINVICYEQLTLQQATEVDSNGIAVYVGRGAELVGVVHGVNLRPNGLQFWIIDQSNHGIGVFLSSGDLGYTVTEGDALTIRGVIDQYAGLTQINPDEIQLMLQNDHLAVPKVVLRLEESTESKLLRINNLEFVDPAEWTNGMGNSGFTVRAVAPMAPNDTISIRIDRDVDLYDFVPLSNEFDLIGIGSQFDFSTPADGNYQILPRYQADIIWENVSTKDAKLNMDIQIGPNPTLGALWIRTAEAVDNITIYNSIGQTIHRQINPSIFYGFDLSSHADGTYFIRFEKDGKARTELVQKQ